MKNLNYGDGSASDDDSIGENFGENGDNIGENGENIGENGENIGENGENFGENGSNFGENFGENGGNIGEKNTLNKTQLQILEAIRNDSKASAKTIAEEIGMTSRSVEINIHALKKQGLIERIGPAKGGHWIVKQGNGQK